MNEHDKISIIVSIFLEPKGSIKINAPGEEPTPTEIAIFQNYHLRMEKLGLSGLVMQEHEYKAINGGNKFNSSQKPGLQPRLARSTATEPTTAQLLCHQQKLDKWKKEKQTWSEYKAGEKALQNLILNIVNDKYINELNPDLIMAQARSSHEEVG